MIRAARFVDIPAMVDVLREAHQRSIYAALDTIDAHEANRVLMNAIQRHGGAGESGTWVAVSVVGGVVEGFIIGVLHRVYHIGTKCTATDLMWITTDRAPARDKVNLLRSFVAWAKDHKKCIEIVCAASGAFPEPERAERIYRAVGFEPHGGLWRMVA